MKIYILSAYEENSSNFALKLYIKQVKLTLLKNIN